MPRLLALAALLAAGCLAALPPSGAAIHEAPAPAVRVAAVEPAPSHREVLVHGVTTARQRGDLSLTVGGRLIRRPVDVGDRVAAGDVLAAVDPSGLAHARVAAEGQVARLQAQVDQLRADRQRLSALTRGTGVSDTELEQVASQLTAGEAALASARAQAAEAGRQVAEARLVAPFDGVVTGVGAEIGETLSAGHTILTLAGDGAVEVRLQVPEAVWAQLHPGDPCTVELVSLGRRVDCRLRAVGAAAAPDGLFPVVAEVATERTSGLTARVGLALPLDAPVQVPLAAIVDPTGASPSVQRVVEGRVEVVPVELRELLDTRVAVRGALAPGDRVVVAGHGRTFAGDRVEVLP